MAAVIISKCVISRSDILSPSICLSLSLFCRLRLSRPNSLFRPWLTACQHRYEPSKYTMAASKRAEIGCAMDRFDIPGSIHPTVLSTWLSLGVQCRRWPGKVILKVTSFGEGQVLPGECSVETSCMPFPVRWTSIHWKVHQHISTSLPHIETTKGLSIVFTKFLENLSLVLDQLFILYTTSLSTLSYPIQQQAITSMY